MSPEYANKVRKMYFDAVTNNENVYEVNMYARKIMALLPRYQEITDIKTVPAKVIGLINMREGSCDLTTHLANGDPLSSDTKNEPKNLMALYRPDMKAPFSFVDAGVAALEDFEAGWNIDLKTYDWSDIASVLWFCNAWNGFPTFYKINGINTPYLWSYTQYYTRGYFGSDGKPTLNAVNLEPGVVPVLKLLNYTG